MRGRIHVSILALTLWLCALPVAGYAQDEREPESVPALGLASEPTELLAVAGGVVVAVVVFNLISHTGPVAWVLEDLGRGIVMIGAAFLGGAGGQYLFRNWDDLPAVWTVE